MSIIYQISDLPPKIQDVFKQQSQDEEFECAVKTNFKPDATIPILWLVLTKSGFLLCNTHRTRGLTGRYSWDEINEVRKKANTGKIETLEIIFNDLSKPDTILPMPQNVTAEALSTLVTAAAKLRKRR